MRTKIQKNMKRIIYLPFLLSVFAFFSCDRNEVLVKTSTDLGYNVSVDTIQFGSYGGKDTVDIPFENCYLHYVRNNDSVLFFYLMEPDYAVMDSIIEARSIIVEPKELIPDCKIMEPTETMEPIKAIAYPCPLTSLYNSALYLKCLASGIKIFVLLIFTIW